LDRSARRSLGLCADHPEVAASAVDINAATRRRHVELLAAGVGEAPYAPVYVPEPYRVKINKGDTLKVHADRLDQAFDGTLRWISSDPAFTPYYALNASDRARLM
jgi:hypothetical protein